MMKSVAAALTVGVLFAACTPTFDWREVRPEEAGLVAMFPCRPSSHARPTALGGRRVEMYLYVCSAGDMTFALSYADVGDPGAVAAALVDLRAAATANIQGHDTAQRPMAVPGMTPNDQALRVLMQGRLPSGSATQVAAAFFVRNTRVYQATVMAPLAEGEAAETFFSGLALAN